MSKPAEEIKLRKTIREDAELDITPMIDVVFLLLAFFVVVSKMDPTTAVDLPKAQYGFAVPEKNCVVFVVTQGATPTTRLFTRAAAKRSRPRSLMAIRLIWKARLRITSNRNFQRDPK